MYIVTVTFEIKLGYEESFEAAVLEQARNSVQREPGCHVFDVATREGSRIFFLYEKYENAAAFEAHLRSEHFITFDGMVAPWVFSKTVETWSELVSES